MICLHYFSLYRKERLQKNHEKEVGQNPTPKKLDNFKKKNISRTSPPRGYVERVFEKLGETMNTGNMDALGLSARLRRIKDPSTMQIWKEVAEEYTAAISINPVTISNIDASSATPLQNSGSRVASTKQDDGDIDEDYRIVTTTLQQIVRGEHSLADIEQQLVSEQKVNHQVFEAFYNVIREVTDMVILVALEYYGVLLLY